VLRFACADQGWLSFVFVYDGKFGSWRTGHNCECPIPGIQDEICVTPATRVVSTSYQDRTGDGNNYGFGSVRLVNLSESQVQVT